MGRLRSTISNPSASSRLQCRLRRASQSSARALLSKEAGTYLLRRRLTGSPLPRRRAWTTVKVAGYIAHYGKARKQAMCHDDRMTARWFFTPSFCWCTKWTDVLGAGKGTWCLAAGLLGNARRQYCASLLHHLQNNSSLSGCPPEPDIVSPHWPC